MNIDPRIAIRIALLMSLILGLTLLSSRIQADTGMCEGQSITLPFTDVPNTNIFFCTIAEAYFSGFSIGTDGTHYSPAASVSALAGFAGMLLCCRPFQEPARPGPGPLDALNLERLMKDFPQRCRVS